MIYYAWPVWAKSTSRGKQIQYLHDFWDMFETSPRLPSWSITRGFELGEINCHQCVKWKKRAFPHSQNISWRLITTEQAGPAKTFLPRRIGRSGLANYIRQLLYQRHVVQAITYLWDNSWLQTILLIAQTKSTQPVISECVDISEI